MKAKLTPLKSQKNNRLPLFYQRIICNTEQLTNILTSSTDRNKTGRQPWAISNDRKSRDQPRKVYGIRPERMFLRKLLLPGCSLCSERVIINTGVSLLVVFCEIRNKTQEKVEQL